MRLYLYMAPCSFCVKLVVCGSSMEDSVWTISERGMDDSAGSSRGIMALVVKRLLWKVILLFGVLKFNRILQNLGVFS